MTELTPQAILAQLFEEECVCAAEIHSMKALADMAIQRLTDAGLAIVDARTLEQLDQQQTGW
jgi:L-arabinose isomerase